MAGDQTQVVAGRNLVVYTAPWVATPGGTPTTGCPLDSVPWDNGTTGWGTVSGFVWSDRGYTRDGLRFRMAVQRNDVNVDQVVDPVMRIPQRRDLNMETALAQINAKNLNDSTGQGGIFTVQPGAGAGHQDFIVSPTIVDQYIAAGFDILNPGDLQPMRIIGWKGLVMADVEMQFQVADAARIAFNVAILPDTSLTPANPGTRVAMFRDVAAAGSGPFPT